jgi:peptidyl-prolyl cis-trans isomerase C
MAAMLTASLIVTGCAEKPAPATEEEVAIEQTEEIFTPQTAQQPPAAAVNAPDAVLVVVEGNEITQADVNEELARMFPNAGDIPPAQMAQMQAQMNDRILETLIIKQLLTQEAASADIQVPQEQIDETIEKMKASLPPGTTMAQQLQSIGMTEEEFRSTLAEDLKISNLMKERLGLDQEPTEEEIQAFYAENAEMFERPESVQASHVLIKVDPADDEAAKAAKKAKAEELQKKLAEGADFAEVAKADSECPSSARGGDLGSFTRGQMVPEFEEAAFSQEIGAVGPVIETQFGYHIVKVTDKQEAGKVPFEEAKELIVQRMQNEKGRTVVGEYIEELKANADIQYPEQ